MLGQEKADTPMDVSKLASRKFSSSFGFLRGCFLPAGYTTRGRSLSWTLSEGKYDINSNDSRSNVRNNDGGPPIQAQT